MELSQSILVVALKHSLDPALHALYGEGDQKKCLFVCVVVVVHACTVGYNMYICTLLQKNAMHHYIKGSYVSSFLHLTGIQSSTVDGSLVYSGSKSDILSQIHNCKKPKHNLVHGKYELSRTTYAFLVKHLGQQTLDIQ